ncbi:MAG TPA: tetratricopeptide repeat protein [Chthoniobacterales bacterium]|nr:tetratricopeptide repeat protein [Chthoniobacterales bacterium]
MKTAVRLGARPSFRWLLALILPTAAGLHFLAASESDYLPDDGERTIVPFHLDPKGESQADAMAHFVTGVLQEESDGPEKAINSYRKVLELDPGYTKLGIEVAYDYVRRGETTEAIGILKDAIKAKPEAPEPALALSSIYLRHLNKPDLASRYAEAALKADPGSFAAYESLWEISQYQGDAAGCAKVLDRAQRAKTDHAAFWLQLAEFLANSNEGDPFSNPKIAAKLTDYLEKAAKGSDQDGESLAKIADFYLLNRKYDKAATYYQKAAELKPNLPNLNEKLAGALVELGRKDDAIPVLERVVAGNPLALQAYDQLYRLYEERGDHEKALTRVEQALIIDKTNVLRHRDLLLLLLRTGRIDAAITRAEEARKLFPQVPFFTYVEARALTAAKRNDEALRAFEQVLVESSSSDSTMLNGLFYFDYACAAQQAGHSVKAAELFQKSIELDPKNPEAYNALGYMWIEQKQNLPESERLIRKALTFDPENGAYLDSLGWCFYQSGKYEEALAELLRAAKAMPESDSVVFEHIGDTYRALNRTAEAVLYWQKAIQLDPGNKVLLGKIDAATDKVAQKPDQVTQKPQ